MHHMTAKKLERLYAAAATAEGETAAKIAAEIETIEVKHGIAVVQKATAPAPAPAPGAVAVAEAEAEAETWEVDIGYNAPVVFTAKNGKIENVRKEHGVYNERRYSKWWIAAVGMKEITSASGKKEYKQVFEFGDFVGESGYSGFTEINMRATVYAYGRKDNRGNNSDVTFFTKEKVVSRIEAFNILKELTIRNINKRLAISNNLLGYWRKNEGS